MRTTARKLVEELAGSLSLPEKWRGKDIEQVIESVKHESVKNFMTFDQKLSKEFKK